MKRTSWIGMAVVMTLVAASVSAQPYVKNRLPLQAKPYLELPLGSIQAKGWLREMLHRQETGSTGRMDELYPEVMGPRNGWLGGDGDQWERGPYWIDGLLPLAYITGNEALKKKVQPWVEGILNSQKENGYFGPDKDYGPEPDLQRSNSADWWPRMVAIKILQQYYSATRDERVPTFLTKYFRYQLATLPEKPLGHWTYWAEYRVCDNLQAVYWLYNLTGESFLLQLADLLHRQGFDFTNMFLNTTKLQENWSIHCVNLAQGLKEPVLYYQQHADPKYLQAVRKGLDDLRRYDGQPQGMYGGDEGLHGNIPTQGSELCSAVELMYSMEKMMEITGDTYYSDYLERVAFNALPTQISDDFMLKQYFQQANQVMLTRHERNFFEDYNHGGTDVVYGDRTGFVCCWSNMHQAWPKFTQSLWYATEDDGLAALVYSPSEVTAQVAGGVKVRVTEETNYPMGDRIVFTLHLDGKKRVSFPLKLRIPGWCREAAIQVGEGGSTRASGGQVASLVRDWRDGDRVVLTLPMEVRTSTWYQGAVAVERGPLVYALRMDEKWEKVALPEKEYGRYGKSYLQVTSDSKWNYGLVQWNPEETARHFQVQIDERKCAASYFWNLENAPISILVDAKEVPQWKLYNEMAGPMPYSTYTTDSPTEKITLVPYGCTTLRITEFPLVRE